MEIQRSVYSFGSQCDKQYGKLVLMKDGSIYGYSHPNERNWSLDGDQLLFHGHNGRVTSRFRYCAAHGAWFGNVEGKKWPLYLVPVIRLGPQQPQYQSKQTLPPVFVNSIPKSGTYFMEAALKDIGLRPTRIHVSGTDIIDDYRGIPDEEVHRKPCDVRLSCPIELVTALLQGEVILGHVEHASVIQSIKSQGVCVLSLVRNLRDVVLSLYRFKLNKVEPKDTEDCLWRDLSSEKSLEGFIFYEHDKGLRHIRSIAKFMLQDRDGILLRYEDLCRGVIPQDASAKINRLSPHLAAHLPRALKNTYEKKTPTMLGKRTSWQDAWTSFLESYFQSTGLAELNAHLGYE